MKSVKFIVQLLLQVKHIFRLIFLAFIGMSINANAQLTANFEADTLEGCDILAGVKFTDLSTGGVTSWDWDFGNGSKSTLQNPTANYVTPGTYDVKLVVSNGTASNTITRTAYITVHESPKVKYSVNRKSGCTPLEVLFQDSSTVGSNPIQSRTWDFGDGAPSKNQKTVLHRYLNGGTFPTTLIVTDTKGCKGILNGETIKVTTGPIANFSSSGTRKTCISPHTVNFTNLTDNHSANVVYKWDFGDSTFSNQRNPSKTYTKLGSYNVKLVASNGVCADSITLNNFVDIGQTKASFSLPKREFCYYLYEYQDNNGNDVVDTITDTIRPLNLSTGGDKLEWDFGDGTTSTNEEPWHVYPDTGWYTIKLKVSAGNQCVDDTSMRIYIQSTHAQFTSTPDWMCLLPDTFHYEETSVNAVSWSWRFQTDSTRDLSDQRTPIYPQTVNGLYHDTLIVTSSAGCKDTLVNTRDARLPGVEIVTDTNTSGCSPWPVQFTAQGVTGMGAPPASDPIAWSWDFDNGETSIDSLPPIQTFIDDTTYTIEVKVIDNTTGCESEAVTKINVGLKGQPEIEMEEDSLCINDTIVMEGKSPILTKIERWQWDFYEVHRDSTEEAGEFGFNRTLNFPVKQFIERRVRRDTVIGPYGIDLITIYNGCNDTVQLDPDMYIMGPTAKPLVSTDSCSGRTIRIETQAIDADLFSWDFGDGYVADTNNPAHEYAVSGGYLHKYKIGNSITGCEVIDSIRVGVAPFTTEIIATDTVGCAPFELNMSGKDNLFVQYIWILNNKRVGSKKELNMLIDSAGTYDFMLINTNFYNCKDTAYQRIVVNGPTAEMGIELLNQCLPLNVAFRDNSNYRLSSRKSIKWDFGNGLFSNRTFETSQYFARDTSYTVSLMVEDNLGCKDTLTYTDTIHTPDYLVDFSFIDSTLCVGDQIKVYSKSKGNNPTFSWEFGDGSSSGAQDTAVHNYNFEKEFNVKLIMKDPTGCIMENTKVASIQDKPIVGFTADTLNANCFPIRINFTDTSKSDYLAEWEWDFGAVGQAFFQNPPKTFNQRGEFDVRLTATTTNGCVDSLTKQKYIKIDGPEATYTISKDTVCKFEDVTFEMQNAIGVDSISWLLGDGNVGLNNPFTYQYKRRAGVITTVLQLFDATRECVIPIVDSLFVEDVIASFVVDDTAGCEPHSIAIVNNSQRADEFGWDLGDGTTSTDLNPTKEYLTNGNYEIVLNIKNQNGCVDTAYQTIVVQAQPIVESSNDTTICEGDIIQLWAEGGAEYAWTPNEAISDSSAKEPQVNPVESTLYKVVVTTSEDCADSTQVQVDVQPKPEPYTLIKDTTLIIGEKLNLNVNSGPSYSYLWTPNQWISCTDCGAPVVQPLEQTVYFVDITDPFNCFAKRDSIDIDVIVDFTIAVPKAFTPNNDNNNDVIYVKGWGIKELLEFKIYNRWGELVFETNDINEGWDGTYKGTPQNTETYIYTISVNTYLDEVMTKRGNISLMR